MESVNEILKFLIITTVSMILLQKIRPVDFSIVKRVLEGIGITIFITAAFLLFKQIIAEPHKTIVIIIISGIILTFLRKERFEVMLTITIIVYAGSYVLYLLSVIISSFFMYQLGIPENSIYTNLLACFFSLSIIIVISRLKMNLSILLKKGVAGIFLFISGVVFVFYSLLREDITRKSAFLLMGGFILIAYGIYNWLRREFTISHNENANEIIKRKLENILDEKEKDNELLTKAHDYLASVVHKDNKKIDALQRAIEKLILKTQQIDILSDAQKILEEIKESKAQAATELCESLNNKVILPQTGLPLVDAKFEMLLENAVNNHIDFNFEINGNIDDIEKSISQLDLVNIIGDFAENSFIAIQHLDKKETHRTVLFILQKVNSIFEISVSDNGIPFEIDTLVNLGIKRTTTHANDGGSGYGYITIFKNIHKHGASLLITEHQPDTCAYSKSILLRFDNMCHYTVKSFRADTIRKRNNNGNLTIKDLKT